MKLLKRPDKTADTVLISRNGQWPIYVPDRGTIMYVEIVTPDFEDPQSVIWDKLKYGTVPDLAEAMHKSQKIDKIEFPEDGLILYGVSPTEQKRTNIWEGCVFKCSIDYYEEI